MKFSYLELDCTLPILIPYVKCIPQISLPESSELYRLLYNELQYAIRKSNRLHELPFLSDQGSCIIKFCNDNSLDQFFCIRHIINLVGAKSFFGKLVRKFLMSQTEPEFVEDHQYVIKKLNVYYQENKNILSKVLKYCFLCISDDRILADPEVDEELLFKTTLYNRGYIVAASNHIEGFHRHLKIITALNLGIEHNMTKLIELIFKGMKSTKWGESCQKLCERLKKDLLDKQSKYNITPIEE